MSLDTTCQDIEKARSTLKEHKQGRLYKCMVLYPTGKELLAHAARAIVDREGDDQVRLNLEELAEDCEAFKTETLASVSLKIGSSNKETVLLHKEEVVQLYERLSGVKVLARQGLLETPVLAPKLAQIKSSLADAAERVHTDVMTHVRSCSSEALRSLATLLQEPKREEARDTAKAAMSEWVNNLACLDPREIFTGFVDTSALPKLIVEHEQARNVAQILFAAMDELHGGTVDLETSTPLHDLIFEKPHEFIKLVCSADLGMIFTLLHDSLASALNAAVNAKFSGDKNLSASLVAMANGCRTFFKKQEDEKASESAEKEVHEVADEDQKEEDKKEKKKEKGEDSEEEGDEEKKKEEVVEDKKQEDKKEEEEDEEKEKEKEEDREEACGEGIGAHAAKFDFTEFHLLPQTSEGIDALIWECDVWASQCDQLVS